MQMMRVPFHKGKQKHGVFTNGGADMRVPFRGVFDEIVEIPCCLHVGSVERFPFNEISSHVLLMVQEEEHITESIEEEE